MNLSNWKRVKLDRILNLPTSSTKSGQLTVAILHVKRCKTRAVSLYRAGYFVLPEQRLDVCNCG